MRLTGDKIGFDNWGDSMWGESDQSSGSLWGLISVRVSEGVVGVSDKVVGVSDGTTVSE